MTGGATPWATFGFTQVFSVSFQHAYYNVTAGRCPDFKVTPTPACAKLMASLGMMFRDDGAGFGVFIDTRRVGAMIDYVQEHLAGGPAGEAGLTRLTFILTPVNPLFIGITKLPITTNPTQQNLYASNLTTNQGDGALRLGANATLGQEALHPVTGADLTLPAPAGCAATLTDISGMTLATAVAAGASEVSFDLGALPQGFYTVAFADPGGNPPESQSVVYPPSRPMSLCMLDLLLTPPPGSTADSAAFPIPSTPPAGGGIQAVNLILAFQPRDTFWQYFVVSGGERGEVAKNLQITAVPPPAGAGKKLPKPPEVTFTQTSRPLPNGDEAVILTADTALSLFERSPYRFKLTGQRQGANGARDQITVSHLPVAASAPVWPSATGGVLSGLSEIYVYV